MAKLTLEIPDDLVNQIRSAGHSIEAILPKALTQYLASEPSSQGIMQTRTWQLCGRFALSHTASAELLCENADAVGTTNDAEQVDDVLYQGF
jgi:hypothetical protein